MYKSADVNSLVKNEELFEFFSKFPFPNVNGNLFKKFKGDPHDYAKIKSILDESGFKYPLIPGKLSEMYNLMKNDEFYNYIAVFVLNTFLAWFSISFQNPNPDIGALILQSLIDFSRVSNRSVFFSSFVFGLNFVLSQNQNSLSELYIYPVIKFYSHYTILPSEAYLSLPLFLHRLKEIDSLFLEQNLLQIAVLFTLTTDVFTQELLSEIIELIHPFILKFNDGAIQCFIGISQQKAAILPSYYFKDIASSVFNLLCNKQAIFINLCENYHKIEGLSSGKSSSYMFSSKETFSSGFKLYEFSTIPKYFPNFNQISQFLDQIMNGIQSQDWVFDFVESLLNELSQGTDSSVCIEYCFFVVKSLSFGRFDLISNNRIQEALFKSVFFDPELQNNNDNNYVINLRSYIIEVFLATGNEFFLDKIYNTTKLFPSLFSEFCIAFYNNISLFGTIIKNQKKLPYFFKEAFLFYRSVSMEISTNIQEIERIRTIIMSLLHILLEDIEIRNIVFSDKPLVESLILMLFEIPLQSFVLSEIRFLLLSSSEESLEYILASMNQCMYLQIQGFTIDTRVYELFHQIIEILSSVQRLRHNPFKIDAFIATLCEIMVLMEPKEQYKPILDNIIQLFSSSKYVLSKDNVLLICNSYRMVYSNTIGSVEHSVLCELMVGIHNSDIIYQPNALILLFSLFENTFLYMNSIEFIKCLVSNNTQNATLCSKGELDLYFLSFLGKIKNSKNINSDIVQEVLSLVSKIVSSVTTPAFVTRFVSLLVPNENHLSDLHPILSRCLHSLIMNEYWKTSQTISLGSSYGPYEVKVDPDSIQKGIILSFWIKLDENQNMISKSILLFKGPEFSLSITTNGYQINLNRVFREDKDDYLMPYMLQPYQWYYLSFYLRKKDHNFILIPFCNYIEYPFISIHNVVFPDYFNIFIGSMNNLSDDFSEIGPVYVLPPSLEISKRLCFEGPIIKQITEKKILFWFNPKEYLKHYQINKSSFAYSYVFLWNLDLLIPMFSLFDLCFLNGSFWDENSSLTLSILSKSLLINEKIQEEFVESKKIIAISALLKKSSIRVLTYSFYLQLYSLFQVVPNYGLQQQILHHLLTNLDIWIGSNAENHMMVLDHWSRVLYTYYMPMLAKEGLFSQLLHAIQIYYPYEKSHLNNKCDSSLNFSMCRSCICSLLISIACHSFSHYDLESLFFTCITDESCYKSHFLVVLSAIVNTIPNSLISIGFSKNDVFLLLKLLNTSTEDDCFEIISIIVSIYQHGIIEAKDIGKYIDIMIYEINTGCITSVFNDRIKQLMVVSCPSLIQLSSWIACWTDTKNQQSFIKSILSLTELKLLALYPYWFLWLMFLVPISNMEHQNLLIDKIILIAEDNWVVLYSLIPLISSITGERESNYQKKFLTRYLNLLLEGIIRNKSSIPHLISFTISYLFVQRYPISSGFNVINDCKSESEIGKHKIEWNPSNIYNVILEFQNTNKDGYIYGLKTKSQEWEDSDLALLLLRVFKLFLIKVPYAYQIVYYLLRTNVIDEKQIQDEFSCLFIHEDISEVMINITSIKRFEIFNQICSQVTFDFIDFQDQSCALVTRNIKELLDCHNEIFCIEKSLKTGLMSTHMVLDSQSKLNKESQRIWGVLWSSLSSEKGPWSFDQNENGKHKIYWIRDNSHCFAKCPFKMKKNSKFNDHSLAISRGTTIDEAVLISDNVNSPLFDIEKSNTKDNYPITIIKIRRVVPGIFKITNSYIEILTNEEKPIILYYSSLSEILLRNRLHRPTSIEIFSIYGNSYFIDFSINAIPILERINQKCQKRIRIQICPFKEYFEILSITKEWLNHSISNFEYLMSLNIYSGRSFNDLSQYPIFPWVISDWKSQDLELNNENSYRDLKLPIGALGEKRLRLLKERTKDVIEEGTRPYLYSSGPVSTLTISLFLVRMEPFTSSHIALQGGRFDLPERQVSSIGGTFELISTQGNEFWELIPEFYYQPEFLVNMNGFDIGIKEGRQVDDIELPPWASSPMDFIYKHRKALESDYVSSNLNNWIDLIWGYKQKGIQAEEANNIYFDKLYSDVWDRYPNADEVTKIEIETYLIMVGQIPPQLFLSKHPEKTSSIRPKIEFSSFLIKGRIIAAVQTDRVFVLISEDGGMSEFVLNIRNNQIEISQSKAHIITKMSSIINHTGNQPLSLTILSKDIIYVHHQFLNLIVTLNTTIRCAEDYPSPLNKIVCSTSSNPWLLICGDDCVLCIYHFSDLSKSVYRVRLYHDEITCCDINSTFHVFACGTRDGSIVIGSLTNGCIINVIDIGTKIPRKLSISPSWGFICVYVTEESSIKQTHLIDLYSINGQFIRQEQIDGPIQYWYHYNSSSGFDFLMYSTPNRRVYLSELYYLKFDLLPFRVQSSVVMMSFNSEYSCVIIACEDGLFHFYPITIK